MATVDVLAKTLEVVIEEVINAADDYIKSDKASSINNKELLNDSVTLLIATRRVQLFNKGHL